MPAEPNNTTWEIYLGLAIVFIVLVPYLWFTYWLVYQSSKDGEWRGQAVAHFPAIVGLPVASAVALLLVEILKAAERDRGAGDKLEVKWLGIQFSGASGPILLWLVCFLGIALAIKLLWPSRPSEGLSPEGQTVGSGAEQAKPGDQTKGEDNSDNDPDPAPDPPANPKAAEGDSR